jgi:hypothetical protein
MNIIDLQNDLTLELQSITHDISIRFIAVRFLLTPTLGTLVQEQPDKYRLFDLQFSKDDPSETGPVVELTLQPLSPQEIVDWFKAEYIKYRDETISRALFDTQLQVLFEYILSVGVK